VISYSSACSPGEDVLLGSDLGVSQRAVERDGLAQPAKAGQQLTQRLLLAEANVGSSRKVQRQRRPGQREPPCVLEVGLVEDHGLQYRRRAFVLGALQEAGERSPVGVAVHPRRGPLR